MALHTKIVSAAVVGITRGFHRPPSFVEASPLIAAYLSRNRPLSTHCGHSLALTPTAAHAPRLPFAMPVGIGSLVGGLHHSMTSSARAESDGGIVRPSALAVFKFSNKSTLVDCSTGRSPGLAPARIRPT